MVEKWLYPDKTEMPYELSMPIWDHLDELRERVIVGALAAVLAVLTCFAFSKDLVIFLEAPVASQGVRFLQLSPGEFFFTTLKASVQMWPGVIHRINSASGRECCFRVPASAQACSTAYSQSLAEHIIA